MMSEVTRRVFLLTDEDLDEWTHVQEHLEGGWVKDPDVPYNPYGTENTKLLHLVKKEAIEEVPEKPSKYEGLVQTVKVEWPKASTLEELEEAQKHLMNELLSRGWVMMEHYSKDAILILRKVPESTVKERLDVAKAMGEKELPAEPEEVPEPPAPEAELKIEYIRETDKLVPRGERATTPATGDVPPEEAGEPEVLHYRKAGSGESVMEMEAGPEAVAEAERNMQAEMKENLAEEVIEGEPSEEVVSSTTEVGETISMEIPPEEAEKESFNKEDLGCDWCDFDPKCTDQVRQINFDAMREAGSYQCGSFKEAAKTE